MLDMEFMTKWSEVVAGCFLILLSLYLRLFGCFLILLSLYLRLYLRLYAQHTTFSL
jgi:hypothetical protein